MSYSDQRKRISPASLGTVIVVHVGIGYALISGLAYQVIQNGPLVTHAELLPDDPVPPPKPLPPEPRQTPTALPRSTKPIVDVPLTFDTPIRTVGLPPVTTTSSSDVGPSEPPAKIVQSLARVALPEGDKSLWVTTEDYPASALRDGREGTVAMDLAIDSRGRVSDCTVIASSGDAALDQTTCRTYARRARFRPALDEGGQPIATHRTDRVRWEIPR